MRWRGLQGRPRGGLLQASTRVGHTHAHAHHTTRTFNTTHTPHSDSHEMQIIAFIEYRSINRIYVCMWHACMHARIVNTSQLQLTTKSQSIIDIYACLQECMHVIRNPISCTIDYHWTIPIPCGAITRDEAKNKDPRPFDTLTDWQRVWQSTQRGGALPFLRMCQLRRRKQAYELSVNTFFFFEDQPLIHVKNKKEPHLL